MTAQLRPLAGSAPDQTVGYSLADLGYTEQEFLLTGTAESYRLADVRGFGGQWSVRPAETAPFATRVVLRRPADDADFSGTVVVEWLNVSGGLDAAPDWMMTHTHLVRSGHAWAGVSAQRAGIEGGGMVDGLHLKRAHPGRYAGLGHPGDAWAFDIFSQAGHALRGEPGLLPAPTSTRPLRLLASGHSQSGAFLVTYVNAIDPIAAVYDGFLVHGRTGSGAALDTGFEPGAATGAGEQIRADLRVPVIVLQTETDVALLGNALADQPDGDLLRNWEIAGAAHADTYLLMAAYRDDGRLPAAELAQLVRPTTNILFGTTPLPVNSGLQHHYVECAAVAHLDAWVAGRAAPPAASRLAVAPGGRELKRDDLGIALGGIRTPWTDVPAAILSGTGQRGELFAFLFGTTRELDAPELGRLYPGGEADYLGRFEESLDGAIKAGFLLAADRSEILAVAAAAWPG